MGQIIYYEYDVSSEGGEPESDEEYSERSHQYNTFEITRVFFSSARTPSYRHCWNSFELPPDVTVKPGDELTFVIARYSDGDTFGSSSGHHSIIGVYPAEDPRIDSKVKWARTPKETLDKKTINKRHTYNYREWDGYFNHLEGVEVNTFTIQA